MCFRPAGAVRAIQCPECGAFNKPDAAACQKCGFEAPPMDDAAAPAPSAPGNAPAAPKAPGNAPKAPGGPPQAPADPSK